MTTKAYRKNFAAIDWSGLRDAPPPTRKKAQHGIYIIPDIQPYRSPIDGTVITSRPHHRDHMREHGVSERGNEPMKPHKRVEMPDPRQDIVAAMKQKGMIG